MKNIRNRLINFRVTNEEFEYLKTASDHHKARCLSDFARTVILRTAGGGPSAPPSFDDQMLALERRLADLEANMANVLEAFEKLQSRAVTA